ncbi:MAG: hypothetical protein E7163_00430 [Firmicutes bacterium]|nr:hypothetical protein [Bacillota bacterium]
MKKYFEFLNVKNNKINELKKDIDVTKNKINETQVNIVQLNKNYIEILSKIEELKKTEKEKDSKEIFAITISSIVFLVVMIFMLFNSFNFNLIKIIIETISICLSGYVIGNIGVKIINVYYKKIRKNNIFKINKLEKEEKNIKKKIFVRNLELIKLQEQEKLFLFELDNEEKLYENLRNTIKEKCLPIIDDLIVKEIENKNNNEHNENLILIREVLHGEL